MIENILKNVGEIVGTSNRSNTDVHKDYSLFSVLEIVEKEVIMCRMLTDLINPKGAHGRGAAFLKIFFTEVLGIDGNGYDLKKAIVQKEHVIPCSTRRIDITIEIDDLFIPIEVKIDACEQSQQCFDYYQYAKKIKKIENPIVYYLTKYGNMPSERSTRRGSKKLSVEKDICTISFRDNITRWLEECIAIEDNPTTIKVILEQYLIAVKEMTGILDMELTNIIKENILADSESFNAAISIEKTLNAAKIDLTEKVFAEIEKQMDSLIESKGYNFTKDRTWYYYKDKISEFYKKKKESFPGITYIINGSKMYKGKKLILRVECSDFGLYSGFSLFQQHSNGSSEEIFELSDTDKQNIRKYLDVDHFDDDTPFYSVWLPSGKSGSEDQDDITPDFREMNDAAIKLVDEEYRKEFVEKSINVIQEKLLSLII
ncbi:MAG: PD-(D/E)XK nuclease family protein [Firmicutes bacterium]|nr:PD-(D/E)XK nuclease family protein [Bacillota bacterium]